MAKERTVPDTVSTRITINDVTLAEGSPSGTTAFTFSASLSNPVASNVTVDYATANGTATTADSDYTAASGTLTFIAGGALTQTVTVNVNKDSKAEAGETFYVNLSNAKFGGATDAARAAITDSQGVATILNDDALPGDANGDGTVNGADLNTVLSNYNRTGMDWAHGDFNSDGTVNGADLNTVLSNYNQSVSVAIANDTIAPSAGSDNSARVTTGLPLFVLTAPAGGAYVAGEDVALQWNVENTRPGSKIGLYYDEDRVWNNGNEHWIEALKGDSPIFAAEGDSPIFDAKIGTVPAKTGTVPSLIAAADGKGGYAWNTADVPAGTYYVAGAMSDGEGACSYSYRVETITISAMTPAPAALSTLALKGDSPIFAETKIGTVPATRRADLLTAVLYEMADLRGNHDDAADGLIDATLPLGARITPA